MSALHSAVHREPLETSPLLALGEASQELERAMSLAFSAPVEAAGGLSELWVARSLAATVCRDEQVIMRAVPCETHMRTLWWLW